MSIALRIISKNKNVLSLLRNTRNTANTNRSSQLFSTSTAPETLGKTPPKYTTSKAAKWKASESFYGKETDEPWYQMHILAFSTTVFLIYFCVLREENDIDEKLYQPLVFGAPKEEKAILKTKIEELKAQGKDYKVYQDRLLTIEKIN